MKCIYHIYTASERNGSVVSGMTARLAPCMLPKNAVILNALNPRRLSLGNSLIMLHLHPAATNKGYANRSHPPQ